MNALLAMHLGPVDPDYIFWKNALLGIKQLNDPNTPQCGYYRLKRKTGNPIPIAYYKLNGKMMCRIGEDDVGDNRAVDTWTWCCGNPVPYEHYLAVSDGEPWPDIDATVSAQQEVQEPQAGDEPETEDAKIKKLVDAAVAATTAYAKIGSDEVAVQGQTLRDTLLKLRATAVKNHTKEKEPFLEGGRRVDKKWFPLRDAAENGAGVIRSALTAWENVKFQRQKKADAEAAEAQAKAAREAEEERRRQIAADPAAQPIENNPPAPPPVVPPRAPPAPIKGATGKAASVQTVNVPTIVDFDKVYAVFKDRTEVKELLTKLVNTAVRNGTTAIDGVTIEEARDVR